MLYHLWEDGVIYKHENCFSTNSCCIISFDNGIQKTIKIYNLINCAFWRFPHLLHMTTDHHDRNINNNHYLNLSWETKSYQVYNRKFTSPAKTRPVIRLNPETLTEIKRWDSAKDASKELGVSITMIRDACRSGNIYKDSLWLYKEEDKIDGEIFRIIPIYGLELYEISDFGRAKLMHGTITYGSLIGYSRYRGVTLVNTLTNIKRAYPIHILVAITFVLNPDPQKYKIVNHKDSIRDHNKAPNLEWTDRVGNANHAFLKPNRVARPVNLLDMNHRIVSTYPSTREASRQTKIDRTSIFKQCRLLKKSKY